MAFALKLTHHIHKVLKDARTGDPAVFCYVPNQKNRQVSFLSQANQPSGNSAYLRDTTRATINLWRLNGLNRINHQKRRRSRIHVPQNGRQRIIVGEQKIIVDCSNAFCPSLYLRR